MGRGRGKALASVPDLTETPPAESSDAGFAFPSGGAPCSMSVEDCLCPLDWFSSGLKPWWRLTKLCWAEPVYGGTRVRVH